MPDIAEYQVCGVGWAFTFDLDVPSLPWIGTMVWRTFGSGWVERGKAGSLGCVFKPVHH